MPERTVTIPNPEGLQARNSAKLVKLASRFSSEISISHESETSNGKSIMGVMMLAACQGTSVLISAEGEDAIPALDAIESLIRSGFKADI